jgi:SulP family sulfate permease
LQLISQWLPTYEREYLATDLAAGLALSTLVIPQSMAYAILAGLPVYIGLYSCVVPVIAYAVFGTSRHMSVGTFAVVSLLVNKALSDICHGHDTPEQRMLASGALAVLVGLTLILFGLTRFGTVIFRVLTISEPLVTSFVCGSAFQIATSQVCESVQPVMLTRQNV